MGWSLCEFAFAPGGLAMPPTWHDASGIFDKNAESAGTYVAKGTDEQE